MTILYEQPEVHARRWLLHGILSLSLLLVVMSVSGLNVALATLQVDLGASATQLQWIVNAYAIVFGGLLLTAGAIGDRFGRKGALLAGLIVFAAAAVFGGLASSAPQVLAARAVMGLGAAFVMPATLSLITEIFPPDERAKAIATWAGFAGGGAAIGPLLTGLFVTGWWVVPSWGWEAGFFYNVPVVVVVVIAVVIWLPTSADAGAPELDLIGAVLSVVALVALLFGIIEGPERGWTSWEVLVGLGVAVVVGTLFARWQNRAAHPMLPLDLFRDQQFSVGAMVVSLTFVTLIGFWFLFALYLQFVLGYSALEAGLATMPEALVSMVVAPATAGLASRFGSRLVMGIGFLGLTASFAMLTFVGTDTSYWYFLGPLTLAGAGLALTMTPATNDIMAATPERKAGVGSAVNDTAREFGAALGIATFGALSNSLYRSRVDLDAVPTLVVEAASDSIGAALETAGALDAQGILGEGELGAAVAETGAAFAEAFSLTMAASGVVTFVAAAALLLSARAPQAMSRSSNTA